MRETSLSLRSWLGPLCLPMLVIIQPLTDYNLRTTLVLVVLSVFAYVHYRHILQPSKHRSWIKSRHGVDRHCDKCDRLLVQQVERSSSLVRPATSWRVRSLRTLPWRVLSRNWGAIANYVLPAFLAHVIVWMYARLFSCRVHEAEPSDLGRYRTLGEFFRRRLRAGARPVCPRSAVVSPADGTLTCCGKFEGGFLEQVKGVHYSLNYFLGLDGGRGRSHAACDDPDQLLRHKDGSTALFQWVVYLSPGDYHRYHSPADWTVRKRRHFPGELLSVKPGMVSALPGLFHLNERVSYLGDWRHGFFSLTAVGATNVGSIHADWDAELKTNLPYGHRRDHREVSGCSKHFFFAERRLEKSFTRGEDFGYFNFGSTIVLVFEAPKDFKFDLVPGDKTLVGKGIGTIHV